jgi:small-conductance mechanosensitive channel
MWFKLVLNLHKSSEATSLQLAAFLLPLPGFLIIYPMDINTVKIIQTIVVLLLLVAAQLFTRNVIKRFLKKFRFSSQRRKLTIRIINLLLFITTIVFISAIWGVRQSQMAVFISSIMAVLGIAFVAQWSLLSNITAGLILFFNHPLKIGDHIKILEKDFVIEGTIHDITFFFVHIKTTNRERISIANNIFLQKNISIVLQRDEQTPEKENSANYP